MHLHFSKICECREYFGNLGLFFKFGTTHDAPGVVFVVNFTIHIPLILEMVQTKDSNNLPCSFQEFTNVKL